MTFTQALDSMGVRRALAGAARHYVYILLRPDLQPFYVGKGVDLRVLQHEADARCTTSLTHKLNLIRRLHTKGRSVGYWIDSSFADEASALKRERELIALIGRHDQKKGPLTNQTDGGEGASNPSEESRQRRRDSLWGTNPASAEQGV
ncbi:MAG: GIY-YIG nuclease family protein, partial [Caldisericota bacterium]|nr:GIY-YIG nuclease family protein [Caldisericota bacterium]